MENQVSSLAGVLCGACDRSNHMDAKFCAGCGHSLVENCGKCAKPVLLTQVYCGECGANMEELLQLRRQHHEGWMADAVAAAKEHDYERAKELLARVAELKDYRFQESARDAAKAIEKIRVLEERALAAVKSATALAIEADRAGKHHEVTKHLAGVPTKLLDEASRALFTRAQAFTQQWTSLESELRTAISQKDWMLVGNLVQQLLELDSTHPPYVKLAEQVAEKLVTGFKRSLLDANYELAVSHLDAIPKIAWNDEIRKQRELAENIHWLSEQFDSEPYASPMLGRLAVRLAKETPNDSRTQKLVQQLSHQLKHAPRSPRMHLPAWKGGASSWLGGEVGVLAFPKSIRCDQAPEFKMAAGRFNVAIGLAIQGLGKGRISDDFLIKKKGLLPFSKRKGKSCWGLDIGTYAVKGVLLEENEHGLEIVDTFFSELENPLSRRREDLDERNTLRPEIEAFLQQKQPGDLPVWVNLAASQTVNRFVRLPPVKDKEAINLLNQEVANKVPIPIDELVVVRWIHESNRHTALGRPAAACTARRGIVSQRIDLLESCGLKVAGLQCDTLALVNFATVEFADKWTGSDSDAERNPTDSEETMANAVVLIDCGASTTNVLLVSSESHWCWTLETGGEDITNRIASATKTTHSEAEKLKRNPAALPSPATQYQTIESRLDELRARLAMVFADGLKQDSRFRATQTWCMGGACQTHQWIRRVTLESKSSL